MFLMKAIRSKKSLLLAAATAVLLSTSTVPAQLVQSDRGRSLGGQSAISAAQRKLMAIQRDLVNLYMNSYEMEDAKREVQIARLKLRAVREDVLRPIRETERYQSLKEMINQGADRAARLHEAFPPSQQEILARANANLDMRRELSRMEFEALDTNEAFFVARTELIQASRAYSRRVEDAAAAVRGDPRFIAAAEELRNLRNSLIASRRNR
jgi:hypothetical protein